MDVLGYVLGLLLLCNFINDLDDTIGSTMIRSADDTNLGGISSTLGGQDYYSKLFCQIGNPWKLEDEVQ